VLKTHDLRNKKSRFLNQKSIRVHKNPSEFSNQMDESRIEMERRRTN
jgi:hypothetical protein